VGAGLVIEGDGGQRNEVAVDAAGLGVFLHWEGDEIARVLGRVNPTKEDGSSVGLEIVQVKTERPPFDVATSLQHVDDGRELDCVV